MEKEPETKSNLDIANILLTRKKYDHRDYSIHINKKVNNWQLISAKEVLQSTLDSIPSFNGNKSIKKLMEIVTLYSLNKKRESELKLLELRSSEVDKDYGEIISNLRQLLFVKQKTKKVKNSIAFVFCPSLRS